MIGQARSRLAWILSVSLALGLAVVASAIASVCHPDPPGTQTLWIRGDVHIDSMRGGHVGLTVREGAACYRIAWNVSMKRRATASCATRDLAARADHVRQARLEGGYVAVRKGDILIRRIWIGYSPLPLRTAVSEGRVFVLTSPAANGPARLLGYDVQTGRKTVDYPVPYSGRSLDVAAGVAIFSTTGGSGLFGLRLSDGAIAFLGAERAHDNPQIERGGIAYRDNLYRHRAKRGVTIVKFVPITAVQKDLAAVSRPLRTAGVIRALAMDGPRVSLALAGSGRACDRILHWNIPWHYAAFISQPGVPAATCPKSRKRVAEVKSVALGGLGSAWVLRGRSGSQLVRENSVACVERVLTKGDIPLVAGDRGLIAYVRRTDASWQIGSAGWRSAGTVASSRTPLRALSVNGNRIAVLRADGTVEIRTRWGSLLTTIAAPGARSIALNAGVLTVLSRSDTLDVYRAGTGRLEHSWRLPAHVRGPVDVHYGVAVVTTGTDVLGIRLATGRTATLAHAPKPVRAQIEEPGIAYEYSGARHGFVGFVPLARIEHLLGRL